METVELAYDDFETDETSSELPPILVLHGFTWNKYMYRDLAQKLNKMTNRKVFVLDLRNHGNSPREKNCSTYLMVEDVKRFMRDRNLSRVSFVCHSFSSSIAYLISLDMPDAVEKMLMIDSSPFNTFTKEFNEENVYPQFAIQDRLLKSLNPEMTLKEAKSKFYHLATLATKGQEYFYKRAAFDLTKEKGKFKWKTDMEMLLENYKERVFTPKSRGSSEHEILVVRCPDSGRVTDSKFESIRKYNRNSRLVTIDNTTHLLMFEESEKFVELARDFFST